MTDPVKRMNYYDHQFLRAPDFQAEQNYNLSLRRRHNRTLHTWGIVEGLQVAVTVGGATNTAVTVSEGFALDKDGLEMVLPANKDLELSNEAVGTLYITIAYGEQPSDPTTEAGGPGNTRITESPNLTWSRNPPPPAETGKTLILATVQRVANGLGTINLSDRRQAGAVVGSNITVDSLTLRNAGVPQANWPALNCSAANQAALPNAGLMVNGKLGIGTLTPNGDLTISRTGAATLGVYANVKNSSHEILVGVDGVAIVSAMTASDLQFRTNNIMRVTVQANTGNVGIGTWTPGSLLEVNKNQNAQTTLQVLNSDTGPAAAAYVLVGGPASGGTYGCLGYFGSGYKGKADKDKADVVFQARRTVLSGQDTGGLHLAATNTSGAMTFTTGGYAVDNERMRIDAAGNVGIGTVTPTVYGGGLEISRTSQAGVRVSATTPGGKSAEFGADAIGGYIQTVTEGATFRIYTGKPPKPNPDVVVDSTGNVGIGTTNPVGYKLQVEGSALLNGGSLSLADTAGQTATRLHSYSPVASLWMLQPTTQRLMLADAVDWDRGVAIQYTPGKIGDAAGAMLIGQLMKNNDKWSHGYTALYTNGAERMRIDAAGNVGIGKVDPTQRLEGSGNLVISGQAYKPGGTSWTTPSDKVLKKDIAPIEGALEKILQLRGVSFAWREPEQHNATDGRYMGMVAQDVEPIFPEWVKPMPDGHKGVELIGFEALVVEAIRQLSDRCERLEAELAQLRAPAGDVVAPLRKTG